MRLRVLLVLLVVGCTQTEPEQVTIQPSVQPAPAPVTSSAPDPGPTVVEPTGQPFVADTEVDSEDGSGEQLLVTDVRVARQAGFDRIVYELDGAGTPGWRVGYVAETLDVGSGEPVAVQGEAYLSVALSNITGGGVTGTVSDVETEVIVEVVLGGVFEGAFDGFIGLREQVPFRVYALDQPARVVVEAIHP